MAKPKVATIVAMARPGLPSRGWEREVDIVVLSLGESAQPVSVTRACTTAAGRVNFAFAQVSPMSQFRKNFSDLLVLT
jgi:hypothetical protein